MMHDLRPIAWMIRHHINESLVHGFWTVTVALGELSEVHCGVIDDFGNFVKVPAPWMR